MTERAGLTAAQALHVLVDEGVQVTPSTLRSWVKRGHVERTDDGLIDSRSLLAHVDARRARRDAPITRQS